MLACVKARNGRVWSVSCGRLTSSPLDHRLAVQGGLYRSDYSKSHNVGLSDALIAATATQWQVPLVTLNRRHFPMLQDVIVPYHKAQPNPAPNQGMEPTR